MLLALYSIMKGNRFKLHPDSVHDGNHWSCFEYKRRESRTELVNGQRIIAVHQHIPTPIAYPHHEQLDLEIVGGFPLSENLQYSLLGILVFHWRSLRTFEPADHIFHCYSPFLG